jgi:hypothetical protein
VSHQAERVLRKSAGHQRFLRETFTASHLRETFTASYLRETLNKRYFINSSITLPVVPFGSMIRNMEARVGAISVMLTRLNVSPG